MRAVWRRCPEYREGQAVWRLEFQLLREGLRTLEADTEWGWIDLGEWKHLRGRVEAVWRYCTGQWLWHGTRTKNERRHFSKAWRALHEQPIEGAPGFLGCSTRSSSSSTTRRSTSPSTAANTETK